MKTTKYTTEIQGQTFTRYHYTGHSYRLIGSRDRVTAESLNLASAWELEISAAEYNDDLIATGERTGIQVKVWPTQGVIKVEGAERMAERDALMLGKALAAASALLADFNNQVTCPAHGSTMSDDDSPALDCEGCYNEMEADLARQDRLAGLDAAAGRG